jgi:CRISPR-associated endoribonuclease Cas6
MRLNLRLSSNSEPVPFDHLHQLTGTLHKWLGENEVHDGLSLYSFGWLRNARVHRGALDFRGGTTWTISFADPSLGKRALAGIMDDPDVTCGMEVREVQLEESPAFDSEHRFLVDGAVLTRRNRDDGGRDHLTFEDPTSDETLTRTLHRKLTAAGMAEDAEHTRVRFDRAWEGAKRKVVTLKGIQYKTSVCPVIVEGSPEAVLFAWLAGVGELTGSGFGALR